MIVERIGAHRFLVVDQRLLRWVAARIPHVGDGSGWEREGAQALGIADEGGLLGAMVVHGFSRQHRECQISMAADTARWATRSTIARMLSYPFDQLKVRRISTVIPEENERAIRFNEGIGFVREGRHPHLFGESAAISLGLLLENRPAWAVAPTLEIA